MRELQWFVVDLLVAAVEQVDVNGSRNVLRMIPPAAQAFLDADELLKQAHRIAFIIKFNDRVQEFSGSRFTTDRLGLVNCRGKNRRLYIWKTGNCFSRGVQITEAIANIRAE